MNDPIGESDTQFSNCWARWALITFGWINVVVGLIGVVVPGLPTTIFLIIAFWAFSKSSARFQNWIWTHPRFGPTIRHWHNHRVIPRRAKILAVSMMTLSFSYLTVFVAQSMVMPMIMALIMVPSAIYVVTRDGTPPDDVLVPASVTKDDRI